MRSELITPSQAAELLNMSTSGLSQLAARGGIDYVRTPGGHRRYKKDYILSMAAELEGFGGDE